MLMKKGLLFVLSAPSGAGKSTMIGRIREFFPDILYSISCTTRLPRKGEIDGVHYHFVDRERFREMIEQGEFLEWKEVHGALYGTPAGPVLEAINSGRTMVLDIDVEGAKDVLRQIQDSVGIFISTPDMDALEERIRTRAADSEESIRTRLHNAAREMESARLFSYDIVNDDLNAAVAELASIIEDERGKRS
jgi:guanylate kinase